MAGYGIFEWDEEKDKENAKKHGYPLRFAVHIFADDNHEIVEAKPDPKTLEPRYMAIGKIAERVVCCVYVIRRGKIRLISLMRRSGKIEHDYRKNLDEKRA